MVKNLTKCLEVMSLYRGDYRRGFHVREIARQTKSSHASIIPLLKEMESEGILRSESIGRNKVCTLNTSSVTAKEFMGLAEKTATIKLIESEPFLKLLKEKAEGAQIRASIIVFGSYAKGYADKKSDIDVLVVGEASHKEIGALKKAGEAYSRKVSVKSVSEKGFEEGLQKRDPLTMEVAKGHVILANHEIPLKILWEVTR